MTSRLNVATVNLILRNFGWGRKVSVEGFGILDDGCLAQVHYSVLSFLHTNMQNITGQQCSTRSPQRGFSLFRSLRLGLLDNSDSIRFRITNGTNYHHPVYNTFAI